MKGFEHLGDERIAVLRWLAEGRVEHVLIGPTAEAIRGAASAPGPVSIVPAPYRRNLDRLASSLLAGGARVRTDGGAETAPIRFTASKLVDGGRWMIRCADVYDLDVEIVPAERYSELLYESGKFEVESGLSIEVASLEDLSHQALGQPVAEEPEIRISRGPAMPRNVV
jgi:hypothetical protein